MTESLFDDIETTAQTPKPRPKVQHVQKNCTCLDCAHFAGRARDRLAVLFKQRKGYCNHPAHPWGVWNVVQDIAAPAHCPNFETTDKTTAAQRKYAAAKLWRNDR